MQYLILVGLLLFQTGNGQQDIWVEDQLLSKSLVLLSRNKPASQSSEGWNGPARAANDGNYEQNHQDAGVCSHTNYNVNPWWKVDLLQPYDIEYVKIYNRGDGYGERMASLVVETSTNDIHYQQSGHLQENAVTGGVFVIRVPAFARYVRLRLLKPQPEVLHLCEVEVYGKETTYTLLSRNKPATQSSEGWNGPARSANDGNYDQNHRDAGICSHTNFNVHPWWQVDLLRSYNIDYVKVYNRGDGSGERLESLIVETSSDGVNFQQTGALQDKAVSGGVYLIQAPAVGRYVRLRLTKPQPEVLHLCEVEVYGHA
jgi:hypothetical protein